MVDGQENVDYDLGFLNNVAKMLPGSHNIALLYGPALNDSTLDMNAALKKFSPAHPNLHIVASEHTDFTTPTALTETEDLLRGHSNVDTIVSVYSDITRGAIEAIQADGLTAKLKSGALKVFDKGGSSYDISAIKAGLLTASSQYTAAHAAVLSVQGIVNAFSGKFGPRFVSTQTLGSTQSPYMITKANVGTYKSDF